MLFSLFRRTPIRSERRREPRRAGIDGRIALDGRVYPVKDWSHRGFSAVAISTEYYPGDRVSLTAEIVLAEETLRFDCRAVVVWVDRERKELAGAFVGLDRRLEDRIMRGLFADSAAQDGAAAPSGAR